MLYGLLFQLLVYNENNLLVKSLRLNSSVLSVLVNNLTQAHVYTVGLKAFTRLGAGPAVEVLLVVRGLIYLPQYRLALIIQLLILYLGNQPTPPNPPPPTISVTYRTGSWSEHKRGTHKFDKHKVTLFVLKTILLFSLVLIYSNWLN